MSEAIPLKRVARNITEKSGTEIAGLRIGLEDIQSWSGRLTKQDAEYAGAGISFQPGDVLFGKLRPNLAKAWLASETGEAVGDFLVIRPGENLSGRFLTNVLLTKDVIEFLTATSFGSKMPRTSWELVSSVSLPSFSIKKQELICDYLDRETSEIDAFIAESERLIELLNERRTAAITQAVTKGLNPDAPMKDSGIEWLGQVPEHWEVRRLGTTVKSAQNGVWGAELGAPEATELRCVRVADFDRPALRIQDRNVTFRSFTPAELQGRVLQRGNLLLEKSGGGEKSPVGFTVLYDRDEPAVCSNFVARVVLRDEMESRFWTYVHHVLYRARLTERSIKQATGIQNLDQSSYFDEKVAVPNKHEQELIADHLDLISETISSSIDTAREGIALARERRQALISAAVTGKIDVRSAL